MAQQFDWFVPLKRIEEQLAPCRVKTSPLLPPLHQGNNSRKKRKPTLVVELIGTLVGAKSFYDENSGEVMLGFTKRPWLNDFLKLVCEQYEVVAFTTSLQALADEILDWLDPERRIFSSRLYRQHCTKTMVTTIRDSGEVKEAMQVKDLERLGRELKTVVLVDHNLLSAAKHMNQGIQVQKFSHGVDKDDELQRVWTVLQRLANKANLVVELNKVKKENTEQREVVQGEGGGSESGSGGAEQGSSHQELETKIDSVNGQRQDGKSLEAAKKAKKTKTREEEKFCVVVPEERGSHLNCNEQGS